MPGLPTHVEISNEVRYKTGSENYSDWDHASVEKVIGTTATINDLVAETEYDFEVRAVVNLTVFSLVSHTKAKTEAAPVPLVETRTVSAPTGIGAVEDNPNYGHIIVTWMAGTSTELNPAAEGFRVEWSTSPAFAEGTVQQSSVLAGTDVVYTITGESDVALADGTWYVRVVALGNGDTTENANPVNGPASGVRIDSTAGVKNVNVVQKPGELAAVITCDDIDSPFFYRVSIWDGTTEYTWSCYTNSLDTSEEESDFDGWFIPTPDVGVMTKFFRIPLHP